MVSTYFGINGNRVSTGSKFRVIWPSVLIIQGGLQQPPLGKYVWEKPSGEQGLRENEYTVQTCLVSCVSSSWSLSSSEDDDDDESSSSSCLMMPGFVVSVAMVSSQLNPAATVSLGACELSPPDTLLITYNAKDKIRGTKEI